MAAAAAAAGLRGNNPLSAGVCLAEAGRVDRTTGERRRWKRRRKGEEESFFPPTESLQAEGGGCIYIVYSAQRGAKLIRRRPTIGTGERSKKKFPFSSVLVDGVWRRYS